LIVIIDHLDQRYFKEKKKKNILMKELACFHSYLYSITYWKDRNVVNLDWYKNWTDVKPFCDGIVIGKTKKPTQHCVELNW